MSMRIMGKSYVDLYIRFRRSQLNHTESDWYTPLAFQSRFLFVCYIHIHSTCVSFCLCMCVLFLSPFFSFRPGCFYFGILFSWATCHILFTLFMAQALIAIECERLIFCELLKTWNIKKWNTRFFFVHSFTVCSGTGWIKAKVKISCTFYTK